MLLLFQSYIFVQVQHRFKRRHLYFLKRKSSFNTVPECFRKSLPENVYAKRATDRNWADAPGGNQMDSRELKIMRHLRMNARESLTRMSRKTGIPVSTIYERLKSFETGLIKKHTCLLDFRELGYDLRLAMLLQARQGAREPIQRFLENHHQVNTVFRVNNGFDFFTEVLFRNMAEVQEFMDRLDELGLRMKKEYYVLEEVRREAFLTSEAHLKLMEKLP